MSGRRRGHTTSATIGGERFSLTVTKRADATLCEVRIGCGKYGSGIAGLMDAYATAISAGLQHGVPLADLLRPGLGLCFAPGGSTDDPEIPRVRSAVDYFSRRLAIDWLPEADRNALGVRTIGERAARAVDQAGADAPALHLAVARAGAGALARTG
jgi:ribonucleoside-diphosphate reductase alpha chain